MEDSILGIIAMIFFVALSLAMGSKKKKGPSGKQTADAIRAAVNQARTAPAPVQPAKAPKAKAAPKARPAAKPAPAPIAQPVARPAARPLAEGESFVDEDGCVGGSMDAHGHEEGSRERMVPGPVAPAERASAVRAEPLSRSRFDAAKMREAVIMSEILDRPKALRNRGGRRAA